MRDFPCRGGNELLFPHTRASGLLHEFYYSQVSRFLTKYLCGEGLVLSCEAGGWEIRLVFSWLFLYIQVVCHMVRSTTFLTFRYLTRGRVTSVRRVTRFASFSKDSAAFRRTFDLFMSGIRSIPNAFRTGITTSGACVHARGLVRFLRTLYSRCRFFQ